MLKYTVKRLAQSLVTILLIATIVFLLMRCLPTDYYFTEEQLMKFTEEQKYAALEAAGLTDPIGTQLLNFYNDLLHLDFGTSRRIQNGASVVKVIGKKFGVSMRLGLISAGISLLVGIMLGILQTAFKDKVFDWIGTAYTVFVNAVPSLVSYSLVLVFGSKYLGFPTLYSRSLPSRMFSSSATLEKNLWLICSRMPTPSPVTAAPGQIRADASLVRS